MNNQGEATDIDNFPQNMHRDCRGRWSWGIPVTNSTTECHVQLAPPIPALSPDLRPHCNREAVHSEGNRQWGTPMSSELLRLTTEVQGRDTAPLRTGNPEKIFEIGVRRFCCEECVIKVERKLQKLEGVSSARCKMDDGIITVVGSVESRDVLATLKRIRYLDPDVCNESENTT
ncbi:hypothetical protein MPTK1_2g12450 [Marchantia polymorpha subsp. ruderalis]|uniref:HMA domain-containing protein n=1 Tax=Marchantia polymorpha TaxID=3197 RepID=A0A2R6XAY0_MARPO|nr:hypothetical protein MARPO_0026s0126 [Marchantia polymorpha]BBN02063.1 hypothetical protein Mp_2g12450 [Marchantia polymorpha subsp. ruderalis]|eukprot:PTQ43257.1 hypothetical protein MARPO_0026s0126 [Marchantia polymorpha]